MLEVHESRRLSLDEVLIHPWLTRPISGDIQLQPVKRVPPVLKQLNEYCVDFGVVKYICTMYRFSEREVVTSVLGRKLTPAAATYHILLDSIESGRTSISHPREPTSAGNWTNKDTKSAPTNLAEKEIRARPDEKLDHVFHSNQSQNSRKEERLQNGRVDHDIGMACRKNGEDKNCTRGFCTTSEFCDKTDACYNSDYPPRRTTSESTDSGVGADFMPEETKVITPKSSEATQINTNLKRQFSYKTFIMDLRRSRQKCKTNAGLKLNFVNNGVVGTENTNGSQPSDYVLLGHSPRHPSNEERKADSTKSAREDAEDKPSDRLDLPALSASHSGSFSPSFPPIALSSPNLHSPSSSPNYSTISGLGQPCVNYNTFINNNGGSFYYSSKPIPGFRHGNRYFLHLDKNNFTACNMGVTGIPSSTADKDRLSCESFAPNFIANNKTANIKSQNVRGSTCYPVVSPLSQRAPPPPPPSLHSCSPFSYLSGEKIELKAVGMQGNYNKQIPSPPLRLRTNNSILQIVQLNTFSKNGDLVKLSCSNSEGYSVYSHMDFNTDAAADHAPKTIVSVQQQRQPVRILASLRDLYGIDPWKRSKSERADLSRAVKRGQKTRQNDSQTCDISPTVSNPEYNRTNANGESRKKRWSKSSKEEQGVTSSTSTKLVVPERADGNESSSSSAPRSNISTPLASEREEFMMPVTSVTIRKISRP
ncbi:hypothetical protein ElyMa_002622700 [Elysia marginata]|uniref:Protein kinase domain-containing protein n=1 Tax=Elysia marginata TaxID=1093978 RepID=A0AAV4H5P7_9GAST|nr:hypothetical protein ElyMa_002622700 [Elysia marginata]